MVFLFVLVVFVSTFLLAAVAVFVASLIQQKHSGESRADGDPLPDAPLLLKEETLSSISVWDSLLAQFDFVEGLKTRISQAGLDWSVGRLTAAMLLLATIALAILTGLEWMPGWLALGLSIGAGLSPYLYVSRRRTKRFNQIQEQFPEALDLMARAMRAGHPFSVSLELLALENTPPLSTEMKIVSEERRLGRSWEEALRGLTRRIPLLSIRLFTAAVLLQNRTGGKLSEVLEGLAETIRENESLQGEVRAIAAHGRLTGLILTLMPIGIAAMMMVVNPEYLGILIATDQGRKLVAAAIVCLIAAHLVIRKIVDIRA